MKLCFLVFFNYTIMYTFKKILLFIPLLWALWLFAWCTSKLPYADENTVHLCLMWDTKPECNQILDPANKAIYSDTVKKVCDMMPMDRCTTYFSNWQESEDVSSLQEAKNPEIVQLVSGSTYTMEVTEVKKRLHGTWVKMLAYNGSIPWPTLQAPQWSTITIKFINKVSHLITTLHSHGVRLDQLFDGVPKSMMGKQDPINYGDSFEYQIHFPDAGVFWYHPHMDEQIQQELWLYGNYIVTGTWEDRTSGFDSQKTLVLDDIQLNDNNTPQVTTNPDNQMLMGRYGNDMLINGQESYTLDLTGWQIYRFYITNVANVRPFHLTIPWAKMKLIWSDDGLYEKPSFVDNLLVWPAERYIVDIQFPSIGTYTIQNTTPSWSTDIATIHIQTLQSSKNINSFLWVTIHKNTQQEIRSYERFFNKPSDKSITLDMTMSMNHGDMKMNGWCSMMNKHSNQKGMSFAMPGWLMYDSSTIEREDTMQMMNDMSDKNNTKRKIIDDQTKKENMDIMRSFKRWDMVKIHITNKKDSMHPMQHPIHFHGQRFLVLTHNGVKNTDLVWKDTVLLGAGDTVDILVDMSNPGTWMAHCHIAEHLMDGMMLHYQVY